MAFQTAAGYGNLPQGNFTPEIYSRRAQIAFRTKSVCQSICNTEYFGEIADYGDTVHIIREPEVTVLPYSRGTQVTAQDLDDDEITLTVDQANYFAFKVDDIEKKQAHHNWNQLASSRAGYQLANGMDQNILAYIDSQIPTANQLGTESAQATIANSGSPDYSPLGILKRMKRVLDEADVPEEGRWFVADPFFWELIGDEDSNLLSADYAEKGILRNGRVSDGMIRGFNVYMSNNLATVGTGSTATSGTNGTWLLAGHISAVASAEQINKTETYRDPDSFADVVRGMHMFGRKALRTEALVGANWRTV